MDLPPTNVRKVLDELATMNQSPHDISLVPMNQRVIASRDMNLILELQKFEERKISLKSRNLEGRESFKQKVKTCSVIL